MTLKFVPPKEQKLPRYASYGGGVMKTHTEVGHAKQSLGHRSTYRGDGEPGQHYYSRPVLWHEGFILELVDGEWFTLYHVEEGTNDEDLPWKKESWVDHRYGWSRQFVKPTYRPEDYSRQVVSVPMSRDEYAAWRVAVELEKRGIVD